jgi:DNA-binding transcriptional MerR regulator
MKKIFWKTICTRSKRASHFSKDMGYTWKEIKEILQKDNITLQDEDVIKVGFTEGWEEGSSARDPMYDFEVIRQIEETDEQLAKRMLAEKKRKEELIERRYQQYLELHKEFGDHSK